MNSLLWWGTQFCFSSLQQCLKYFIEVFINRLPSFFNISIFDFIKLTYRFLKLFLILYSDFFLSLQVIVLLLSFIKHCMYLKISFLFKNFILFFKLLFFFPQLIYINLWKIIVSSLLSKEIFFNFYPRMLGQKFVNVILCIFSLILM